MRQGPRGHQPVRPTRVQLLGVGDRLWLVRAVNAAIAGRESDLL
jgi:hypothetical protein